MQPSGYGHTPSARLDATFAALADPTRRAILARLSSGEASVVARRAVRDEPAGDLQAPQGAGAGRPHFPRTRCAAAPAEARSETARRGHEVAGTLPAILGRQLPTPRRSARRDERGATASARKASDEGRRARGAGRGPWALGFKSLRSAAGPIDSKHMAQGSQRTAAGRSVC